MKFIETKLKGLYLIEPEPFRDFRGYFGRIYCKNELDVINNDIEIVQINRSLTKKKGTIRGMHFQYPPKAEIKIISCFSGSVFDVAIDLRRGSPTFLHWHAEELSSENMKMIYIPKGFAHGFQALEDNCELLYLHSEFYSKEHESGIRFNDKKVNIKWPLEITEISERDNHHQLIDENFTGIVV